MRNALEVVKFLNTFRPSGVCSKRKQMQKNDGRKDGERMSDEQPDRAAMMKSEKEPEGPEGTIVNMYSVLVHMCERRGVRKRRLDPRLQLFVREVGTFH